MPCCILIALFSQPLVLLGGIKARLFSKPGFASSVPIRNASEWRWLGLTGIFAVELVLASAAAPYVMAMSLHGAGDLTRTVLDICSVSAFHLGR